MFFFAAVFGKGIVFLRLLWIQLVYINFFNICHVYTVPYTKAAPAPPGPDRPSVPFLGNFHLSIRPCDVEFNGNVDFVLRIPFRL